MPNADVIYWREMKEKAAANVARVTEWEKPVDEAGLKSHVARAMKLGNCGEKAEVLVEAMEFMTACHMLNAHSMAD